MFTYKKQRNLIVLIYTVLILNSDYKRLTVKIEKIVLYMT